MNKLLQLITIYIFHWLETHRHIEESKDLSYSEFINHNNIINASSCNENEEDDVITKQIIYNEQQNLTCYSSFEIHYEHFLKITKDLEEDLNLNTHSSIITKDSPNTDFQFSNSSRGIWNKKNLKAVQNTAKFLKLENKYWNCHEITAVDYTKTCNSTICQNTQSCRLENDFITHRPWLKHVRFKELKELKEFFIC